VRFQVVTSVRRLFFAPALMCFYLLKRNSRLKPATAARDIFLDSCRPSVLVIHLLTTADLKLSRSRLARRYPSRLYLLCRCSQQLRSPDATIRVDKSATEQNKASVFLFTIRVIRGSASAPLATDDELRDRFTQCKVIAHLLDVAPPGVFETTVRASMSFRPWEKCCNSVAPGMRITNEGANA
jgi:hypothetical protein